MRGYKLLVFETTCILWLQDTHCMATELSAIRISGDVVCEEAVIRPNEYHRVKPIQYEWSFEARIYGEVVQL